MDDILSFGAWLKQRRNELGYTQQGLASLSGCSPATIRKIEAGERKPSRQVAGLLVQSLDVPLSEHEALLKWAGAQRGLEPQIGIPQASSNGVAPVPPPSLNTNLPVPLTPLIGRDAEVEDLSAPSVPAATKLPIRNSENKHSCIAAWMARPCAWNMPSLMRFKVEGYNFEL